MYKKQTWEDGIEIKPAYIAMNGETYNVVPATVEGGTIINKDRLNHMEEGIYDSYTYTDTAIQKAITDVLESEY